MSPILAQSLPLIPTVPSEVSLVELDKRKHEKDDDSDKKVLREHIRRHIKELDTEKNSDVDTDKKIKNPTDKETEKLTDAEIERRAIEKHIENIFAPKQLPDENIKERQAHDRL